MVSSDQQHSRKGFVWSENTEEMGTTNAHKQKEGQRGQFTIWNIVDRGVFDQEVEVSERNTHGNKKIAPRGRREVEHMAAHLSCAQQVKGRQMCDTELFLIRTPIVATPGIANRELVEPTHIAQRDERV